MTLDNPHLQPEIALNLSVSLSVCHASNLTYESNADNDLLSRRLPVDPREMSVRLFCVILIKFLLIIFTEIFLVDESLPNDFTSS